ncbi:MAG: hypothetical protein COW30_08495 [Rhodospirillales bacterium CG15_BIG_FIL_POST_REV_8_21_14_020_66_15]|nr:MAG: hypothetical protein COW30_08495 [Rhodospirillales bacterium CG15_BIG_FIL_POST_REV_8_21_14_020_66_15]
MLTERIWFVVSSGLYSAAAVWAVAAAASARTRYSGPMVLLGAAIAANSVSIVLRWLRLGHGPYVDLYETLTSGVWGYHLAVFLACLFIPRVRPMLAIVLVLFQVMVVWALSVPTPDSPLPVTYDTIWLPVHLVLGKAFIGCVVVALALASVVLVRWGADVGGVPAAARIRFPAMPADASLDELAFRFMLVALVFETLMLVAGAIWAQNAWGRYWDWDPLETWAFLTWTAMAIFLHFRVTKHPPAPVSAILIVVVFALGFYTFFGLPFISVSAHKGAV